MKTEKYFIAQVSGWLYDWTLIADSYEMAYDKVISGAGGENNIKNFREVTWEEYEKTENYNWSQRKK